jgi:cysteine protease ATG4
MHYVTAYSSAGLEISYFDRVRKMPLSGLDPSMLIGFLSNNEQYWINLRQRVTEVRALSFIHNSALTGS